MGRGPPPLLPISPLGNKGGDFEQFDTCRPVSGWTQNNRLFIELHSPFVAGGCN